MAVVFLGPVSDSWAPRSAAHRRPAASRLGVDQGTLAKWEQGKREPVGAFLARVKRFLGSGEESGTRRVG